MRSIFFLFGIAAIGIASPHPSVNVSMHHSPPAIHPLDTVSESVGKCATGFAYNNGWCIYRSNDEISYQKAVNTCSSMGLFAPSFHSKSDFDFWRSVANEGHFWLDAYCPSNGKSYVWLDGTPTNYFGPNNELKNCQQNVGIHMENFGVNWFLLDTSATALCVYDASNPPSKFASTTPITTQETTTSPALNSPTTEPYCDCNVDKFGFPDGWNPSEIWLDVVVVLDTSNAMDQGQLEDAETLIESLLSDGATDFLTTDSQAKFYTRLGVITMPDNKVLYDLNMTSSDTMRGRTKINKEVSMINLQTGFESAQSMLNNGLKNHPERTNTRQVVYFMTASYKYDSQKPMNDFKSSQGIIIVDEFVKPGEDANLKFNSIPSEGYYYMNSNSMQGLQAFCKANCFCGSPDMIINGKTASGGCYHTSLSGVPFNKAKAACSDFQGFLATVHNGEKGTFLQKLLNTSKSDYFWIGYEKLDDGNWQWEDHSSDSYTNWGEEEPSNASVSKCAYIDSTNSTLPWGAGNCQVGFPYVCQSAPCSTGYMDCI